MNWAARGNVLNLYLRNTSIGTTVRFSLDSNRQCFMTVHCLIVASDGNNKVKVLID